MVIRGEKVILRSTTVNDISTVYKWATQSEATPFLHGELYGDHIPTYQEFTRDWKRYYFDGSEPEKGRCFVILAGDKAIGQINYNEINRTNNSVELDIFIAEDANTGKGYGTDALRALSKYLFQNMNIQLCEIEPITKNPRAIRAYEKAGFEITRTFVENGIEWNHMELRNAKTTNLSDRSNYYQED